MVLRLLARIVILALIIGLVAKIVGGVHVHGGFLSLLWIAVLFSLVNAVLGPVFRLFGFPLIILTLGLFLLVIDAALLGITAWLTKDLDVDGFWWAVLAGGLIALFSELAELIFPLREEHQPGRQAVQ